MTTAEYWPSRRRGLQQPARPVPSMAVSAATLTAMLVTGLTGLAGPAASQAEVRGDTAARTTRGTGVRGGDGPGLNRPAGKGPHERGRADRRGADGRAGDGTHLVGHGGPVKAIASDRTGGQLLTGSFDYSMIHWRVDDDGRPALVRRFPNHDGAVSAAAFFADGLRAVAASDDGTITFWKLDDGAALARLKGHQAKVLGLDVSPDQSLVASASWDRSVRLWDVATGTVRAVLTGHKGPVNAVRFTHEGRRLVSASYDGTLALWDVARRELIRPAHKHGWGINVLERLPTASHFVFGALDGTAAVIDVDDNRIIAVLEKQDKPILALAHIAKPGLVAVGGGGGRIDVYRSGDWQRLEHYQNPYGPVWAMSFVDRGARLYFGSLDDHATAWRVTPRKPFEAATVAAYPRRFQVSDDISLGERQFARKCSICHTLTLDGGNRAGPTLYGVFGRRIASLPHYPYSEPLKTLDIVWNETTISKLFELGPDAYTPGSKMPLQKIADAKQRDALVAFLKRAAAPRN